MAATTIDSLGKEIHEELNSCGASVQRDLDTNRTIIKDRKRFRGVPISTIDSIVEKTDAVTKGYMEAKGFNFRSLDSLKKDSSQRVAQTVKMAMARINTKDPSIAQHIYDSIWNPHSGVGSAHDPSIYGEALPNVWISPFEANAMYSQKGLPELIINKKSKTILLNGLKIKNAKLSARQIDAVSLNMIHLRMPTYIANAVRDALVYGGDLVFPMFKRDTPATMMLSFKALLKQGILEKGCIDYIVSLDRWNTVHVPTTNPTQKDFLLPEKYYIPFLGSDVSGQRCSRIVPSSQAGYFGKMMTMGWGLSDYCGYAQSLINYKNAVQTIPLMIQQMSILARTINVDGILATEGSNALDALQEDNTIRMSEWSPQNPVTMDLLGNLEVINRDFAEVPSLLRLLRQDLAADATLPEPLLFSSEKGSFSSGEDTEGNLEKQYEAIKYVHKDVEEQFRNLAMMVIIDTLGVSDEILKALPYTEIHFDVPMVANSSDRAEIGLNIAKGFFEFVSGQMPLDEAAKIASAYGGDELSISSELLERLEQRQKEADEDSKKKKALELELLEAQIEQTKNPPQSSFGSPGGAKSAPKPKKSSSGYSRLDQEKHEKTKMPGEKRPEKLAKRTGDSNFLASLVDKLMGRY